MWQFYVLLLAILCCIVLQALEVQEAEQPPDQLQDMLLMAFNMLPTMSWRYTSAAECLVQAITRRQAACNSAAFCGGCSWR
jgi:hypothetical protein